MGDAAFFGIGARSSDLDNVSRSEMCNWISSTLSFQGNVRVTTLWPRRVRGRVLESLMRAGGHRIVTLCRAPPDQRLCRPICRNGSTPCCEPDIAAAEVIL